MYYIALNIIYPHILTGNLDDKRSSTIFEKTAIK
jgi:hypothetical protein